MKKCSNCGEVKELSSYRKRPDSKDGYRNQCKSCQAKYMDTWRAENRDYLLKSNRDYNSANKEKRAKYYQKNKDKDNEYQRNRRKKDMCYRIERNLRIRVYGALRGINRSAPTMELIGCDIEQFKKHIESQFEEGMTWDNYGEWEVDHIRPCVSFDLTDVQQRKECFNYRNTQPLWRVDNREKSDKWQEEVV